MCCSYARTGTLSRGPGLSKKRSRSGKFSNAITPPPCVCLDKGIMRFYASHACFVDLQRCLCTQRHTSRLPACLLPLLLRTSPASRGNSPSYGCRLILRSTPYFSALRYIFLVPIFPQKDLDDRSTKCYRNQGALLSQKSANHGFLNTRRNTVGAVQAGRILKISFLYIAREDTLERSILNLAQHRDTVLL